VRAARHAAVVLAVIAATLAGGYLAMVAFVQERDLSVGSIRLSVSPGHRGALDVYVPLVDWGARFEALRMPVRLRVDLRSVNRDALERVADGATFDVRAAREEATQAIAGYLRALIAVVTAGALALGLLVAFAVRSRAGPRLRYTTAAATVTALAVAVAMVVLLPPRGDLREPQYYAHGADIPRALEAAAAVTRSGSTLDQELDDQLVGLARLVIAPGNRAPTEGRPRITIASDLHNNVLAVPILERAAGNEPLFFAGDLTDRGSPVESQLLGRVERAGRPFVFVSGNHDSDTLQRQLAGDGAVVLTQFGRLRRNGSYGPVINRIATLRVAGYSDPFERRSADDFADRFDNAPSAAQQQAFTDWLRPLLGKVDVVMVHEPELIAPALRQLKPTSPLVIIAGHTHHTDLQRIGQITLINGGSIGGGGTGNLADEETTDVSLARLIYETTPTFTPLAADLVSIDPGTGAATARRERLDE
jgi:predicted phosphodiesterase